MRSTGRTAASRPGMRQDGSRGSVARVVICRLGCCGALMAAGTSTAIADDDRDPEPFDPHSLAQADPQPASPAPPGTSPTPAPPAAPRRINTAELRQRLG